MPDVRATDGLPPARVYPLSEIPDDLLRELAEATMRLDPEDDLPLMGGHTD